MSTQDKDIKTGQEENLQENQAVEQENEVVDVEQVLNEKLEEERNKFLRLFAEFENYKKRTSKERLELFRTAGEEVMLALLPVLDDFDRALAELEKLGESEHLTGVTLISGKLRDTLNSKGLEEVAIDKGDDFNVDSAEAITQIPAGDDMKGKVVDVIERGYKLGDKIIRFPKVVIGQ
ncbi:nucleotide exchange factor GrpE [Myroides guanonis]|uniref:Protein GrpE n=1 Tax=Myroides guanonis TaxID=1150112 RepID=A0A1I3P8H0_9FLAO|nr:nucleotide exchange factor GrpE [Myroides guanonis]SFJ17701.1 molecular chaperone GrpE [Myroides guanonis]